MKTSKNKKEKGCTCIYYDPKQPHEYTCNLNINQQVQNTRTKETYVEKIHQGCVDIIKEIDEIQEWRNKEENQEKDLSENENFRDPLWVDSYIVKKILLSTGGPEDGFKLTFNQEKELLYGVYYRADWGTYEESNLSKDEAQLIYDFYLGGYIE